MTSDAAAQHTVRWGVLAPGIIAHVQVADMRRHGLRVDAVASRDLARARDFAAEFGIARAYGDYQALCADPDIDAIYIASPHPFHAKQALLAISHGKHVLVEKAFAMNARQAQTVLDAASARGVIALEAMWVRYLPYMAVIQNWLAEGHIGRVRAVSADRSTILSTDPTHRVRAIELGGGAILDVGVYPVAFVQGLLGAPIAIAARGRLTEQGVDAAAAAVLEYADGTLATITTSIDTAGTNTVTIMGERGRIEVLANAYEWPFDARVVDAEGTQLDAFTAAHEGRGMQFQALELETLVAEGRTRSEIMSPEDTLDVMRIMDEMRRQIGVRYPADDA
ncbi:MAG TPA: Gfo/Idh/MocA family oxidoreductase [Microbacteriaceae bacterium]|nr:Gfo/Idh/MocA family oxidoreductase [Microbacteriaceae bacterium]